MSRRNRKVLALDIGTSKTCAMIGRPNEDGGIEILGVGVTTTKGVRKGVVVNIDAALSCVSQAVNDAKSSAGSDIKSVVVGISGPQISSFNSEGIVAIKRREVEVDDLSRVLEAARAVAIPLDREVIHIVPQEFIIDDQDGVRDPVGMCGVRLETKVHIVTGGITSAQNIIKCANRTGLIVEDIVFCPIASAHAVLSEEERELGVAVVELGAGTTDLVIYSEGCLRATAVIPMGGHHVTNDIAIGLRTPGAEAETLKRRYGAAMSSLALSEETIEVPSVGGRGPRVLLRHVLCEIIEPRLEELFALVKRELAKAGFEDLLTAGVVLTGGGAAMPGIVELGERIFELPVRVGAPVGFVASNGLSFDSQFATPLGLIRHALEHSSASTATALRTQERSMWQRMVQPMKALFGA